LGQWIAAAQAQGDEEARRILEEHRVLLRRCREVGIERAFAELGGGPPIPPEFQADFRHAQEGEARYRQTRDLAALNEAIAAWERILNHPAFSQTDERFRLGSLNDAGGAYLRRYWRTGNIADLDKALALWRQALDATPPSSPDRPGYLNNLGNGLRARYERTGRLEDLEEAIRVFREAVEATPPGSPDRPAILNNLGNGLRNRYERTGRLEDLEEAIRVFREAVEATPPSSPDRPGYLNNLGTGLRARYERTGRLEDLEEAIRVHREAVEATPPGSPNRLAILNNLGEGLFRRYERTGRLEDLEEAIRVFREAVEATPPDSLQRPMFLNNLGNGLVRRYERTGRPEDLGEVIRAYQQACVQGLQSNPPYALRAGRNWLLWAFQRGAWEETLEAHGYAVQVTEALLSLQFGYPDKAFSLGEVQGLPARAAFSAWRLGQPTKAVEIVEQGRAQLLREALERRRRDLHALAGTPYEPYYTAYIQATRHLDDLQAIPYPQRPPDWGIQIIQALAAQQAAIEALRQNVPGFAYFLKSMPFSEIRRQAAEAPLVYMLATEYGGLALIVRAGGEPQAVELPELTEEALRDRLNAYFRAYGPWRAHPQDQSARQAWFAALDEACRWLWDVAMGRVVEALAGARSAVLIPSGLLGFLPFHAAWREDPAAPTGRRYALDDLLLTYAPSAHALAAARQVAARTPADRLFAVDNPDGSLLFSEEEVAAALKHLAPDQRRLMGGEAANRKAVLKEIPRYSVLHFSTHGRADLEEPLRSGLWMADGALSLGDLMDLRLEGARLAVLSACETGLPGAKLPEEAVSLPSGLIQAGVAGVVGSLWAVSDVSTALLMARFYDLWRKEGLEPPEALRQAQIWLRDSTNAEKEAFFRHALPELGATRLAERAAWVAFWDAVVRRPQDRDFAHPFHWAAFSYMGA
jgi:tetratricopeptide (TPR) repeat protein